MIRVKSIKKWDEPFQPFHSMGRVGLCGMMLLFIWGPLFIVFPEMGKKVIHLLNKFKFFLLDNTSDIFFFTVNTTILLSNLHLINHICICCLLSLLKNKWISFSSPASNSRTRASFSSFSSRSETADGQFCYNFCK